MDNKGQLGYGIIAIVIIAVIVLLIYAVASIVIIQPGEVAVVKTFGTVNGVYGPGFHMKAPWSGYAVYSTKVQIVDAKDIQALTGKGEGQIVGIHATFYYKINENNVVKLYTEMLDYNGYVDSQVRAAIYEVVGQYSAEDLYTNRDAVAGPAKQRLNEKMNAYGIDVTDVSIRGVDLPEQLQKSIVEKQSMQQNIQKKQYEVQVADMEADRKRAEARGIADANEIIAGSLSSQYLNWYWIENLAGKDNTIYVPMSGLTPTLSVG